MSGPLRYLSAAADPSSATHVIQGLPWEGGISWRRGATEAPDAIRAASESIESYSPILRADLEGLALADVGDLELKGLGAAGVVESVLGATEGWLRAGAFLLSLGGDHSVSIGTTSGARRVSPDLAHVVYDAHFDLRESYDGSELSHACGTRHMALAGPTVALGIRSGTREEFEDADRLLAVWSASAAFTDEARRAVGGRPVFVSVDLDVLDPSAFPGTGNPEPGGTSYEDLRASLLAVAELNVVAIDLVELSPGLDPSGRSAVLAAELAREMLLAVRRSR